MRRRTQSDEFRQRFARLRDMLADERRQAFAQLRETRQKQCQATREQLRGTLTAGQYARFTELEFRYSLQRGAVVRALTTAGIKLSDAEMDRLTAVRQEVEAGVRKKIAAIQQQAQMEILGSVMSGEKIQRLLGDDFVFQRSPYPR